MAVAIRRAAGGGVDRVGRCVDDQRGDGDGRQFAAPVQATLVGTRVRGRVVVPSGVVDDALLQPTELLGVERHLLPVEDAPVLDAEGDLRVPVARVAQVLPQGEQPRVDIGERPLRPLRTG